MISYEAPGKLNLSLHVGPPSPRGLHPLESIVQTLDWYDALEVERSEPPGSLEVRGLLLEEEDNLVTTALREIGAELTVPPLRLTLIKELPVGAGLGGGSSDAAATLRAAADVSGHRGSLVEVAARVGSDVPLFLTGGTLRMTGFGEVIEPLPDLLGFAVAVVYPGFGLSTADVYARWDELEGPVGEPVADDRLPPPLRGSMPMRNDLLPAALDLEPRLGDFMSDLRAAWGSAVCLTGAGSACFGYFATIDEAEDAAEAVAHLAVTARGVALRDHGVSRA